MKTSVKAALTVSALLISSAAFAQSAETAYAENLQQKAHVLCHVFKGPRTQTVNEVELTVTDSKATVVISYVAQENVESRKTYANREWSVTESYDDYSDQIQYETLVNLTDDQQNFLLVQFYSNRAEARGVLQIGDDAYDLICK